MRIRAAGRIGFYRLYSVRIQAQLRDLSHSLRAGAGSPRVPSIRSILGRSTPRWPAITSISTAPASGPASQASQPASGRHRPALRGRRAEPGKEWLTRVLCFEPLSPLLGRDIVDCWHCQSIQFPTSSACLRRSDVPNTLGQEAHRPLFSFYFRSIFLRPPRYADLPLHAVTNFRP